jgi:ankyrin repeat protein
MPAAPSSVFEAIVAGDRGAVSRVLDQQPELVSSPNDAGLSPLVVALYHGKRDIAADILARVPPEQLSVHEAASAGVVSRLRQVLDADPSQANAWSADGFQPLGLAAFFGHGEAIDVLLAAGAEVNSQSRNQQEVSALHAALAGPAPELSRVLIAAGADVNAAQRSGTRPLHEAAHIGSLELVELLLVHGADPLAADSQGRTALDFAAQGGHAEVAARLARSVG